MVRGNYALYVLIKTFEGAHFYLFNWSNFKYAYLVIWLVENSFTLSLFIVDIKLHCPGLDFGGELHNVFS